MWGRDADARVRGPGGGRWRIAFASAVCQARRRSTWDLVIADVLAHIHGVGIVHCDIKPSNIGYMAGGMPKLLDFGLARLANDSQQPDRRGDSTTRSGRGAVYRRLHWARPLPRLPPLHRHAAVHVSGGHQQGTAQHPLRPVEPVRGALRGDCGNAPFQGARRTGHPRTGHRHPSSRYSRVQSRLSGHPRRVLRRRAGPRSRRTAPDGAGDAQSATGIAKRAANGVALRPLAVLHIVRT